MKTLNNKTKNNWRGQVWNELSERVPVHPSQAVVIYLAGREDLDRPCAIKRGFHGNNLIAVETDPEVCKLLRKRGTLTIKRSLLEVIQNWPDHTPISAIIADFYNGFTDENVGAIFQAIDSKSVLGGAAIVCNMLRGREANNPYCKTSEYNRNRRKTHHASKHRGKQLFSEVWGMALLTTNTIEQLNAFGYTQCINAAANETDVVFTSYPSGTQWFDGCIFTKPNMKAQKEPLYCNQIRSEIAAILAHRTRREAA